MDEQLFDEALVWQSAAKSVMLAGDFATALTFYRNALAKLQNIGSTELEAELHINVGCMLAKNGDRLSAKGEFASAVLILERMLGLGAEHELVVFARYNLGDTQRHLHADSARKLQGEAYEHMQLGSNLSARSLIEQALPMAEHGARDPILEATLLNQLALTYGAERNYKRAIVLFKEARKLIAHRREPAIKKICSVIDGNLRRFRVVKREAPVWSLIEKATRLTDQSWFEHAEAAAQKAVESCRRHLGGDHPAMAFALHKLGFSQLMLADYGSARRNLSVAKVIIGKWPKHKDEAKVIDFSLAWVDNDENGGGGDSEFEVVPPEWRD